MSSGIRTLDLPGRIHDLREPVSGSVQTQLARRLERRNAIELLLGPRLVEALEGRVGIFHVARVMLAMVQFHDLAGDVGLESAKVVRQIGELVLGHPFSPFKRLAQDTGLFTRVADCRSRCSRRANRSAASDGVPRDAPE